MAWRLLDSSKHADNAPPDRGVESKLHQLPPGMAYAGQRKGRFERAPWRRPRGTHEVVEYLFRNHFDEVVAKLGRHPYTRGTSVSYREGLASEVLKRMLESGQLQRYEPGAVGAWITQAVYRHRNEADRAHTRLSVTEGELEGTPGDAGQGRASVGLDAFEGPTELQPELAVEAKERNLSALELRAQLSEELQQLYQLRWEQGLPPRVVRSHFGWSLKQYEKRDAKLKSVVLAAVQRSVPDSIVAGHGDGTVCRETRELLPLALRQEAALARQERLRLDAHLLACLSCRVAAREAQRVLETVRPLFVPVGPALGGGAALGGGLLANVWAKLLAVVGVGSGGGAAAVKVAGVAGCVAACVVGGEAILRTPDVDRPPKRTPEARTATPADRPVAERRRPATMSTARQTPAPPVLRPAATLKQSSASTARRPAVKKRGRGRTTPARPTPQYARSAPSPPAGEFVPEAPPVVAPPTSSAPPAATSASATATPPTNSSSGAEFAGP